MRYFGRVYRLEIGVGSDLIIYDGFPDQTRDPAQIEFSIDQTPNAERSYCEITIYGVRRDRRKAIYNEFDSVRLIAGWLDGFGSIFEGQIENVALGRDGAHSTVKLFCQSAHKEWPEAIINKSFGKGTPQENIIRSVASTLGYPVELVGDFSTLPKAINGMTLSGSSVQVLRELGRNWEFEWMVENQRLLLVRDGATRSDNDTFVYSAVTGLIGSPSITKQGVDIEVLMNPFIRPWDKFEVQAVTGQLTFNEIYYHTFPDTNGKGVHDVVSITHEGSFYGDSWKSSIEGVKPRAV